MTNENAGFAGLEIGSIWRSGARTLTETDLIHSCMTSGDWGGIHADATYAATTPVKQRIFQGTYGLHVGFGMATHQPLNDLEVIGALGFADWNYRRPLLVGDTVYAEVELVGKRLTSDGARGILERRIRLIRQDGEVVQEGLARTMVRVGEQG